MPGGIKGTFDRAALRAARKDAGLSVGELAKASGVGVSSIQAWEAGTRRPTVQKLRALMAALGGTIGDVMPEVAVTLAERRAAAGLSQAELAERLGVDQATVSQAERGLTRPGAELRRRLGAEFGLSDAEVMAAWTAAREAGE
ncbi:helix-turn-helix transcriptional regulator [Tsukamurella hominis]|uniref:helix-turn-helix transcriptional regulator n=1 Tax=Tsukamurella hominis TaxID=1970232 RepID=UPI0039EC6A24